MDISNEQFVRAKAIKDRRRRFNEVWTMCKAKTVCEGNIVAVNGDDMDHQDAQGKHQHGGCGHRQPQFKKEVLKLTANFKATKEDVC